MRGIVVFPSVLLVWHLFLIGQISCVDKQTNYAKFPMYVEMGEPKVVQMDTEVNKPSYGQRIHKNNNNNRKLVNFNVTEKVPSTELELPYGTKNKNGRVPSKIMIRTFKTTTETPLTTTPQFTYSLKKFPTTSEKPTTTSSSGPRRSPSTTRRVITTSSPTPRRVPSPTTTRRATSKFTFPPYNTGTTEFPTTVFPSTRLTIPRRVSKITTTSTTSTTSEPITVEEDIEEVTTTTETPPTTSTTTSYPVKGRQLKVITKTFKPIYKTTTETPETTLEPTTTTTRPPTPNKQKIHYIITVIGGAKKEQVKEPTTSTTTTITPNTNSSTENPLEQEDSQTTVPEEEIIEEVEEDEVSSTTSKPYTEVVLTPVDPYAHLQTVEIPPSAITDNSPPYDVIRSIGFGNNNYRPIDKNNFRYVNNFISEPPSRHRSNSVQIESQYHTINGRPIDSSSQSHTVNGRLVESQSHRISGQHQTQSNNRAVGQLQLIPLQTVVTYQAEPSNQNGRENGIRNSNSIVHHQQKESSPFFTSKTVLYYTQVSPKHQESSNKAQSFSPNSISIGDSSSSGDSRNRILSTEGGGSRGSGGGENRISSPVAARSYYLDNVGRLPVPASVFGRPIPLLVNVSPN